MPVATQQNTLPSAEYRRDLEAKLLDLVRAIAAHEQMRPPNRHPTLGHVLDYVMRTKYVLSELDNIAAGRPVRHPDQIPELRDGGEQTKCPRYYTQPPQYPSPLPAALSKAALGPSTAKNCFDDVVTRSTMLELMIDDPSMATRLMGLAQVDYGEDIKTKNRAVMEVIAARGRR